MFAGSCRFLPSCSDYAAEAVTTVWRACAARCSRRGGSPAATRSARTASTLFPRRPRRVSLTDLHGKTGSPRRRSVVHRPVRLPGDVSAARAATSRRQAAPAAAGRRQPRGRSRPSPPPAAEPGRRRSAAPLVADTAERDITFENDAVSAVFTTRGGALKSWRLKKYQDAAGQPLELVPASVPPGTPRPFTLSARRSGRRGHARAGAVQAERDRGPRDGPRRRR